MRGGRHRRLGRPQHVVHLPHWGSFETPKGYDYLRDRPLQTAGYWAFRAVLDLVAVVCTRGFLGLRIEGREKLEGLDGGFVSIANHVQMLDCGMVLQALPRRRVYYVSIEENFALAGIGAIVRLAGAVPLPARVSAMREQVDALGKALSDGAVVHVYPEGFLEPYHTGLNPFGSGAFHLAVRNAVPIVPLAICQRPPKGLWKILKRRPCFTLKILDPIWPDASLKRSRAVNDLMERSFEALDDALAS